MIEKSLNYWEKRKDSIYLFVAQLIYYKYCDNVKTVIDIGSNKTPVLEWHRNYAQRLTSVDLRSSYFADGVESIKIDFIKYVPDVKYDMATCFQVMEHVPDAKSFAEKLLECAKVLVVSVPYKWKEGKCKYHIHDPVDEEKMLSWFLRKPNYSYVATELNKSRRLIQVYIQ